MLLDLMNMMENSFYEPCYSKYLFTDGIDVWWVGLHYGVDLESHLFEVIISGSLINWSGCICSREWLQLDRLTSIKSTLKDMVNVCNMFIKFLIDFRGFLIS